MPFDALTMAAVSDEVRASAVGGRIQKIIQPSPSAVALAVYAEGVQRWLLLSADASFGRVAFVEGRLAKAFPTPAPFVMLLRKYLEGARVLDVAQMPHERILAIGTTHGRLIAEVMGKHSNVMLVSEEQRILGAIKTVPPRESRIRPILPGHEYHQPPARDRDSAIYPAGPSIDPYLEPHTFSELLVHADGSNKVRAGLMGLLAGCGPFLADEIAFRAGTRPDAPLGDASAILLLEAGRSIYKLYQTREWEPVTFRNVRGKKDYAPYVPRSIPEAESVPTISVAIDRAVSDVENRDALASARGSLLDRVERATRAAERRVESLRAGLAAAEDAESVMQSGQLVLAYQHLIQAGESELVVPDMELVIPLNPRTSPPENAERLFRRYRKLRDARRRIPELLVRAQAEVDRLREMTDFVRLTETEADLRALEAELTREEARPAKKVRPEKKRGPRRYSFQGFTAIVGRSAQENEEVTFRLSRRDDFWLHARGRTGAHVVLRGPDAPPPNVVEAAAGLAGYFSEGRSDTGVDVDIAAVRDVRKVPGGAPGKVTYRNFRTVRTAPSMGEWQPA